jgi:hypothetical protein
MHARDDDEWLGEQHVRFHIVFGNGKLTARDDAWERRTAMGDQ